MFRAFFSLFLLAFAGAGISGAAAQQQRTVNVGGGASVLIMPKKPRGSVILMPGGHGQIGATADGQITQLRGNQLVRSRMGYARRGKAVLVLDASSSLPAAVEYMARIKRPVTVVATSRGTIRAAYGISSGARPDALVLTSGFLTSDSGGSEHVAGILGSPAALPRTLVIHHRRDGCRVTLPAGVQPFLAWAQGRARVAWLTGGSDQGNPCQARAHHGFNGLDGRVVGLAAGFR
ncbi:MAG: alpha/beta hydrolase [Beijerinckiaceae bacterium]